MRRNNNLFKSFVLIISLLVLAGCERIDLNTWTYLYTWSYSIRYKDLIEKTKCFQRKIVEDKTEYSMEINEDIVGKWHLLLDFSNGDSIDYSCKSITYSFAKNSEVTIRSNVKEIAGGTFTYSYHGNPFCSLCLPTRDVQPNLLIGDDMYFCQVAGRWLTVHRFVNNGIANVHGDIVWIFYRD